MQTIFSQEFAEVQRKSERQMSYMYKHRRVGGGMTGASFRRFQANKARAFGQRRQYRQAYNYIPRMPRYRKGYGRTGGYYRKNGYGVGHGHMQPELKFHDTVFDTNNISQIGNTKNDSLSIPTGTGESDRIGRKCKIRLYSWRYVLTLNPTTLGSTAHDQVRLYVIWDKQVNGTDATIAEVLESTEVNSFRNLANKNRFRVLGSRTHDLVNRAGAGNGTTDTFSSDMQYGEFNIKCNMDIEYSGVTGAIGEIRSNNILLIAISLDGRTKIQSKIRVRFSG